MLRAHWIDQSCAEITGDSPVISAQVVISAQLWSDPVGARQLRAPSPRAPDHKKESSPTKFKSSQHSNKKKRDHSNSPRLSLALLERIYVESLRNLSFSNFRAVLLRH